ncbi:MAG: hypothetical protein U9O98_00965, partial [Asgard group archaeon]|nr:hypothetical protein [Asgard group archaeon]
KSYSLEGHQDNLQLIKAIEPDYYFHSDMYGVDFLAVPNNRIRKYYYPEKRLQEILQKEEKNDEIESKVAVLARLLAKHLEIPFENMGISGSIIWKGQTEKSDIDFIIYGNDYARQFNKLFPIIYKKSKKITPLPRHKRLRYEKSMARKSGLPEKLTTEYIAKKTWLSVYGKTNLSFAFSPLPAEIPFEYGESVFKPVKKVDLSCTIKDISLGQAYPAIYQLSNQRILKGEVEVPPEKIKRILSFEGAFTGYFEEKDKIVVRGLLEEVKKKDSKKPFYQILLGTKECQGDEYIIYQKHYSKIN